MKRSYVHLTDNKAKPTEAVTVEPLGGDRYRVTVDGHATELDAFTTDTGVALRIDNRTLTASAESRQDATIVRFNGRSARVQIEDERVYRMRSALAGGQGTIKTKLNSPMTGKVVLVRVAAGDDVHQGQTLVIIEAMKMENEVKAPGDARIKSVSVKAGDLVKPGDPLVEFFAPE